MGEARRRRKGGCRRQRPAIPSDDREGYAAGVLPTATDLPGPIRLHLFTDGSCPICRRFRAWVEARDVEGRIEVLDLDEPDLAERFPRLDLRMARGQLTVVDAKGEVHRGLSALRRLGQCLPGLRQVDWIYELPGVQTLVAGLYHAVNRYRKGPCPGCDLTEERG